MNLDDVIDERTAWNLVHAVPRGLADSGRAVHVSFGSAPDVELRVEPSGSWSTTRTPDPAARDLLELYLSLQVRTSWVVAQLAQSLDGRIATRSGHSHYVTGREDIRRLHRLRALADAVVVGAGTVEADDPRLTVREVEGANPVRVVLDPRGRLDPARRVLSDGAARTLVVRREGPASRASSLEHEVLHLPTTASDVFDPHAVVAALRARGLHRILVEGGGLTVSRFLEAGALDRLHVTVAPFLMGSGRPSFTLEPIDKLDEARRPPVRIFRLGDDVLFELEVR